MSKIISTFNKNALEEIRVGITEFKGKKLIAGHEKKGGEGERANFE